MLVFGIDRTHHQSVAVGELEMTVDPGLRVRRQQADVELPRRQHHLVLVAIPPVAIYIDAGEIIVKTDILQLPVGGEQRARIPQANVLDGC